MNTNSKLLAAATVALMALAVPATVAQSSTGYGTQIKVGDSDFIPVTGAASIAPTFEHIDFGVIGDVNDDCTYMDPAAGATVSNFDIRVTPCQGKAVGTTVTDADTVEKTGAPLTTPALAIVFADVNNNGRYDAGDYVYATTGAGPAIVASTGPAAFTIRLTAAGAKAAGTYVFAGDSDFVSYGAATVALVSSLAWFDADLSAAGAFTTGDNAYLVPVAAGLAAGSLFPLNSVRLSSGNAAGAYGTQIKLGDRDHVAVTGAASIAPTFEHVDFGVIGDVNDDCTYMDPAAGATVSNFDIRVTPCQGKAAGTTITDADTVEKTGAPLTTPALAIVFADVNNNGRYDAGDYVYATTGAGPAIVASTGPAAFTIRLTAAGAKAAGTYVFAGDSDFVSYGAATAAFALGPSLAWFDADLSAAGAFTTGDSPYLVPVAAGLAAGSLFPLNSVRLGGPQVVSGGNPSSNPGTNSNTGTNSTTQTTTSGTMTTTPSSTSGTHTTSPTGGNTGGSSGSKTGNGNNTPGFELVALVGALAVALVLVRRKL